ncbi:MAG: RluA family pseudouridine synthase [Bacteroidetes bacterium]|nr:RluA family pseudouridine synthase [Bacteroidota bacterium]
MAEESMLDQDNELDSGDGAETLYERHRYIVDKGQEPIRIDKYLISRMVGGTRNKVQQAIEAAFVLVNNAPIKSNYKVRPGDDIIMLSDSAPEEREIVPENIPLQIVFEDDHIIIINKPAGMVVHPGCGNFTGTLVNGVAWHLKLQQPDVSEASLPRFGLVHRIDKNTSGLMVLAKTQQASFHLSKQFFDHTVERCYHALVWGDFENHTGTVNAHIGRHQRFRKIMAAYPDGEYGKEAITHYQVIESFGYTSLVECKLETGRTHQIRVHMQHIGHPLFNDEMYGGNRIVKGTIYTKYKQFVENTFDVCKRHALHAKTLGFKHPKTQEWMFFESDIAEDMQHAIDRWRNYAATRQINT